LKKAIAYLIANANLPFAFVERKSFCDVMCLLNPLVRPGKLLFSRKTIAMGVHCLHKAHSQHIKKTFEKIKHIGFTLDAWTSPNTIAFLGITAHAITPKWELIDIVVSMPQVLGDYCVSLLNCNIFTYSFPHSSMHLGSHTGHNFAEVFIQVLDDYAMADSLVSITADNASNNSTLAARVQEVLSGQFDASKHLSGCMAHVINLAAKDGLQAFGVSYNDTEGKVLVDQMDSINQMHISHLTSQPDGINVNLKTVISHFHGLTTHVQATPQRCKQFQSVMGLVDSQHVDPNKFQKKSSSSKKQPKSHAKTLVINVKTCWNLTYMMLDCALELKDACTMFCH
jgi:hypothetical protein